MICMVLSAGRRERKPRTEHTSNGNARKDNRLFECGVWRVKSGVFISVEFGVWRVESGVIPY